MFAKLKRSVNRVVDDLRNFNLDANTKTIPSKWQERRTAKKFKAYAKRLAHVCNELTEFDRKNAPNYQILTAYKEQTERVIQRHNEAATFLRTSDHASAEADLAMAMGRNQELATTMKLAKSRIQKLNEQRKVLTDQCETIWLDLMKLSPKKTSRQDLHQVCCAISEDMMPAETLRRYTDHSLSLEAAIAETAQKSPESLHACESRPDSEIDYELRAEERLSEKIKVEWCMTTKAIMDREANSDNPKIQEQIKELTERRDRLGVQLALRGMPNRDGKFLRQIFNWDNHSFCTFQGEQLWSRHSAVGTSNTSDENDAPSVEQGTLVARGLFDSVTGIEPPSSRNDDDEEASMTEADFEIMLQERIFPKVEKWRNEIEAYEPNGQDNESDESRGSIATPVNPGSDRDISVRVESSLDRSKSYAADPQEMSHRDYWVLKSRREAWAVQLADFREETVKLVEETSPWIDMSGFKEVGETGCQKSSVMMDIDGKENDIKSKAFV